MKLLKAINNIEKDRVSSDMSSCSTPSVSSRGTMEENITLQNTIPLEYSPISNCKGATRKWENPFPLPERFQPCVQDALNKNMFLTKQLRCKFIQAVYDRICLFTISPTPDQRRDVCRAIVTRYPFLTDVVGGLEIWYRQLGDKVKNEVRNEKSDPVVLARKRKTPVEYPVVLNPGLWSDGEL
ncbi:Hypothetical predicted protein [Paramuricea clavata]|uniref:Uncharacterized protein n=1 Tax=Paramuricea clavata TaxID=317549 RepID=A0A6S7JX67_PARCT|nr:Hypothetical predicted protein [Paramuricea clavata]